MPVIEYARAVEALRAGSMDAFNTIVQSLGPSDPGNLAPLREVVRTLLTPVLGPSPTSEAILSWAQQAVPFSMMPPEHAQQALGWAIQHVFHPSPDDIPTPDYAVQLFVSLVSVVVAATTIEANRTGKHASQMTSDLFTRLAAPPQPPQTLQPPQSLQPPQTLQPPQSLQPPQAVRQYPQGSGPAQPALRQVPQSAPSTSASTPGKLNPGEVDAICQAVSAWWRNNEQEFVAAYLKAASMGEERLTEVVRTVAAQSLESLVPSSRNTDKVAAITDFASSLVAELPPGLIEPRTMAWAAEFAVAPGNVTDVDERRLDMNVALLGLVAACLLVGGQRWGREPSQLVRAAFSSVTVG